MRGLICRGLRLELVAGLSIALGFALALPACALAAANAASETAMTVETRDVAGQTQATLHVTVTGEDGQPATGAVTFTDQGRPIAGAVLDATGAATSEVSLPGGDHSLSATYTGDAVYRTSASRVHALTTGTSGTPNFAVSVAAVSPATTLPMVLTAGQAGTLIATVTPQNNASLTSPMFVQLSCSGLPDQSSCSFTPETVEILPATPASCAAGSPASACPPTSTMIIQTQAQGTTAMATPPVHTASPIAWAILLPGALGLGGLAWGARRRRWLSRFVLMALLALVATLGTTACNPRYYYLNHGPQANIPTPAGSYTITVTAQSSNGITAITQDTTMVLTVQ